MQLNKHYDAAIVGGGLAGLAAAIRLRRAGHSVVLFEKEQYPFHKVCGEYISLESWDFLQSLGVPLADMKLPVINTLLLTAPDGSRFTTKLPLGGFGISRYLLDNELAKIAKAEGVHVLEQTKVERIQFDRHFHLNFRSREVEDTEVSATACCAAYGKRSNLDVSWKRAFLQTQDKRLDNYVGVKYHIRTSWPENIIGLHNFENGYCGISKIEEDEYCLCYMTRADSLKQQGNSIPALEENVLHRNPELKKIFTNSTVSPYFPVTISQINFQSKTQVEEHVLMLGDAAGMITPLCGNGMSIALHTGKIAADLCHKFLSGELDRAQLEEKYVDEWEQQFSRRLRTGRILQSFFGSSRLSNLFVHTFKALPFLARPLVKMTHGQSY
jgi:flavin-dependent dehydrogenase